jgi:hypothetical protein
MSSTLWHLTVIAVVSPAGPALLRPLKRFYQKKKTQIITSSPKATCVNLDPRKFRRSQVA